MDEPQIWQMPAPPAKYVLTVRDCDGREYERCDDGGSMWLDPGAGKVVSWDHLIYNRQPITAAELAR